MTTRTTFAVAALCVSIAGGVLAGQQPTAPQEPQAQPPVTFRTETNYVEVDARVLDADGKFVPGLKASDFQVFEDGKPQPVTAFSLVNIPVQRAERPLFASKPIEADVQTNLDGANGRIYLIVLDDLHVNALRSVLVTRAAKQFIERYVGANDLAAVVYSSGRADASQDFTTNQRLLLQAVDKFMGQKLRSATLNRIDQEQITRDTRSAGDKIDDIDDAERGFKARSALDAMRGLAEYLGNVRGRRKALVLFSEGIDYDINDVFNNQHATTIIDSTRDLIAAATRANVAVYGVDPRGLTLLAEEGIEVGAFPTDTSLGISQSALFNEARLGQDSLRVLSEETGGFAIVNRNDVVTAFQRIVDDNSSYYLLGYYADNAKRDGKFRRIDVKVPGRPGVTVRARKGYVAPRGKATEVKLGGPSDGSTELREAMSSPLPLSALPMATTAAVFKGPDGKGSVTVSTLLNGREIPVVEKNGAFTNDMELALLAVDAKGKSFSGDRNTLGLNMKPETAQRMKALGLRVISSIDLPPGRYQLRVAAREANSKKAGSVAYDLEVPDYSKEGLLMSSLALTSAASSMAPTVRPKDPLTKLLPGPLSSVRDFPVGDELGLFVEVYDNTGKQTHKVDIAAMLKAEGGQTVFQTKETRDSSELEGSAGGYGFTARVPLKDVAPGLYVLRVDARSTLGRDAGVSREIVFRVSPAAER